MFTVNTRSTVLGCVVPCSEERLVMKCLIASLSEVELEILRSILDEASIAEFSGISQGSALLGCTNVFDHRWHS
jgi:hypothetical protein